RTITLPGLHFETPNDGTPLHLNYRVIRTLRELDPDFVLSGGFAFANVTALVYCALHRKKYVPWAAVTPQDGAESSFVMRQIRRVTSTHADGCINESTASVDAFVRYGLPRDRMTTVLVPFEVARLRQHAKQFRRSREFEQLRAKYRGPILLSIGQL